MTEILSEYVISRRGFIRAALAGAGFTLFGPFGRALPKAFADDAEGRSATTRLVVINLYGGNDGLNTVVPVSLQSYADRRESLALARPSLLSLNKGPAPTEDYALHPSLENLASLWADGDVAFINKVGYPGKNLSHFASQDIWSHGVCGDLGRLPFPPSGWIARYADRHAPTPTGAISLLDKQPLDLMGGNTTRLSLDSLSSFKITTDTGYERTNDPLRQARIKDVVDAVQRTGLEQSFAKGTMSAIEMLAVVNKAVADYRSAAVYPETTPASYLRDIATLIQAGFDTRIFFTGYGDFDHHSNQAERHADLLGRLDAGLGAFAADMKAMGTWEKTIVVVVSEFGRRNFANGSKGTDHGEGNVVLLLGGAVKGGFYGPRLTDADLANENLTYAVDFRSVYKELLAGHLGVESATEIFAEAQERDGVLGFLDSAKPHPA